MGEVDSSAVIKLALDDAALEDLRRKVERFVQLGREINAIIGNPASLFRFEQATRVSD